MDRFDFTALFVNLTIVLVSLTVVAGVAGFNIVAELAERDVALALAECPHTELVIIE